MFYVGLDVHLRQTTICVLDRYGRVAKRRTIHGEMRTVLAELARLKGKWSACYEASCGYGPWFEGLSKLAHVVKVAHPGKLRLIYRSKRKSDRVDAEKLAKLLYLNEVPEVHVPDAGVRAWREMIVFRKKVSHKITGAKSRIRAFLRSAGQAAPRSLWSRKGLAWLSGLRFDLPLRTIQLEMLLDDLFALQARIKRLEKELNAISLAHPGVQVLMTIPGIGVRTAEAFVAHVDRTERFDRISAIGSYVGLVPCQDQSAGKNRLGHITKEGPPVVRGLLVEAAWQAKRCSPKACAFFERVRRGDPERKKIAIVATAHWLARVMLSMLKSGESWRQETAA